MKTEIQLSSGWEYGLSDFAVRHIIKRGAI